jgi:cell fate (sporulation/competence/biofilm development) regulator YlbF (YheA/YmcA/DUF963 family)
MAKFTEEERLKQAENARRLWCKGFDAETISTIMGIKPVTVNRWAEEFDFERSKRSQIIALSAIRNSILESYSDLLEGKTPKIKPDEAVKYAAAFEKFSARKQVLTYMHEAYELLDEEYCKDIQAAEKKSDKEKLLNELRVARTKMQNVLTRLTQEVIGDE